MGVTGDIFQIKLQQSYLGEDLLNTFYYVLNGPTAPASEILDAFYDLVGPEILSCQNDLVTHELAECINLFDPVDFGSRSLNNVGEIAIDPAQATPSYLAFGYRFARQRTDMRHGYKRFVGLTDAIVDGNGLNVTNPDYVDLNDLRDYLNDNLNTSPTTPHDAQAVVVKRIKYTTPDGNDAYRLPETQAEATYYVIADVSPPYLTTQNTRKP